jgi:ATP-binding cassette subfamily B protein
LFDRMLLALSENVRGVQVVKGFSRQREEQAKFAAANRAVKDQQQWIFWRISLFTPSIEFLTSLNMVALLGYGGYLVLDGRLPLGAGLIVFCGLLQQFAGQVSKMTNIVNSIQQSLAGAERVFEILDSPIEVHSPPRPRTVRRVRGQVAFDDVAFHYQPGQPVLEGISFRIEPGQRVALLGATGEGKTTLLNLIPRFYDPTRGQVRIDGLDLRQWDLDDLRRKIGLVFQENFLFSDTVAANIAFGRPGATMEQIQRAAKIAAAHSFIMALPHGYDTLLREGGKDLSGGQRQRLAIARAMVLEPPVLLLDDPTASIDPHTEEEILTAMEQAMAGRTTFFVAHRQSALRRADLVMVLDEGRIQELGSHDELLARRGSYWRAARLQLTGVAPIPECIKI